MTLADSGWSQFSWIVPSSRRRSGVVSIVHTSSGDSRFVPDQGAVLEIKEAPLSEFVFLLRAV